MKEKKQRIFAVVVIIVFVLSVLGFFVLRPGFKLFMQNVNTTKRVYNY